MTTPSDIAPALESAAFPNAAAAAAARREDAGLPASLAQEINERRARVENAELLRNLRGL